MRNLPDGRSEDQMPDWPVPVSRTAAPIELIATVALALCVLVAATVVSIGMARADIAGTDLSMLAGADTASFLLAWVAGLLLAGTAGLAALRMGTGRKPC